eukprot:CAMPEP_0197485968 /NCGR_PEP_ID=MMETSP1311-20131121/882_1 /TAXON_ID=464262 /ORGANISM="Genus nov. species nov., Strain RCC856" /LENGTH=63 /DNA_ID=CAMNT_0043028807 /DNA_START=260 /DNA_END=451 /DNA_ORIENTATION=-
MRPGRPRERDPGHLKARMFRDDVDLDSDYMEVVDGIEGHKNSEKLADANFFRTFEDDFNEQEL